MKTNLTWRINTCPLVLTSPEMLVRLINDLNDQNTKKGAFLQAEEDWDPGGARTSVAIDLLTGRFRTGPSFPFPVWVVVRLERNYKRDATRPAGGGGAFVRFDGSLRSKSWPLSSACHPTPGKPRNVGVFGAPGVVLSSCLFVTGAVIVCQQRRRAPPPPPQSALLDSELSLSGD